MMKSTMKKFLVATLSATMIMSSMVFAEPGEIVSNTGETGNEQSANIFYNDVTKVVVPTSLKVALNPQEFEVQVDALTTSKAVVLSKTVGIVNKSTDDKKVTVKLAVSTDIASSASGKAITFKDTADEATASTAGVNDYFVYLKAVPADSAANIKLVTGAAETATEEAIDVNTLSGALANAKQADAVSTAAVKLVSGDNTFAFKLDKATYEATGAAISLDDANISNDVKDKFYLASIATGGATSFRIDGAVNKKAKWSELGSSTIKITPTYTVADASESDTVVAGTAGLLVGTGGAQQTDAAPSIATTTYTKAELVALIEDGVATIETNFGSGNLAATSITKVWVSSNGTDYAEFSSSNTPTIDDNSFSLQATWINNLTAKRYVKVFFDKGDPIVITVNP